MIPDDSWNLQLLKTQGHLPHLSLPIINLVVFPWLFWLAWVLLLVVYRLLLVLVFGGLLLFWWWWFLFLLLFWAFFLVSVIWSCQWG